MNYCIRQVQSPFHTVYINHVTMKVPSNTCRVDSPGEGECVRHPLLQTRRQTLPNVCISRHIQTDPCIVISFCAERCKRLVRFGAAFEVKGGEHSSLASIP